jgi:hypothetical protein
MHFGRVLNHQESQVTSIGADVYRHAMCATKRPEQTFLVCQPEPYIPLFQKQTLSCGQPIDNRRPDEAAK